MSLDVYLEEENIEGSNEPRIFIRRDGQTQEISREEWDAHFPDREPVSVILPAINQVYWRNITHNLGKMAAAAGIYDVLWRPDEMNIKSADQLIMPLTKGLQRLQDDPVYFKQFNPSNGWGDYEGLVEFVCNYLAACKAHPVAHVRVSR